MMDRFQNIINRNSIAGINGIRFKNQTRLFFGEHAAFHVIGIIGHSYLKFMIKDNNMSRF